MHSLRYAEVLENTQYALIATVQRLYTMIRNNESWDLGDPELNDRGQLVIHDVASRLGCIRPSPDQPITFPEGDEDFAELQAQLEVAHSEMTAENTGSKKKLGSSSLSPSPMHSERASSTEMDPSIVPKSYIQTMWAPQQQQIGAKANPSTGPTSPRLQRNSTEDDGFYPSEYSARGSIDPNSLILSPVRTDFRTQSPMFRKSSPFNSMSTYNDFLRSPHELNLTAHFTSGQQFHNISGQLLDGVDQATDLTDPNMLKVIQLQYGLSFVGGTITPRILNCNEYDQSSLMHTCCNYADNQLLDT
jgi:hypothetical protein